MKVNNLWIKEIAKEETQVRSTENISNKLIKENNHNIKDKLPVKGPEA